MVCSVFPGGCGRQRCCFWTPQWLSKFLSLGVCVIRQPCPRSVVLCALRVSAVMSSFPRNLLCMCLRFRAVLLPCRAAPTGHYQFAVESALQHLRHVALFETAVFFSEPGIESKRVCSPRTSRCTWRRRMAGHGYGHGSKPTRRKPHKSWQSKPTTGIYPGQTPETQTDFCFVDRKRRQREHGRCCGEATFRSRRRYPLGGRRQRRPSGGLFPNQHVLSGETRRATKPDDSCPWLAVSVGQQLPPVPGV